MIIDGKYHHTNLSEIATEYDQDEYTSIEAAQKLLNNLEDVEDFQLSVEDRTERWYVHIKYVNA
jgi:hypothetical protein